MTDQLLNHCLRRDTRWEGGEDRLGHPRRFGQSAQPDLAGPDRFPVIKIGAKVISHGRYVAFQMAEVAIPRTLFADILRLIAELRPPPDPATA